jgi:hypothetical protein
MVKIDGIANEIAKHFREYTADVQKKVRSAENKVTKEAVTELKAKSPVGESGRYAAGWTKKREDDRVIIHNKDRYQLAHLLEHGHAKRGGGRVPGKVHIKPVEEKTVKEFEKLVEKAVKS